MHETYWTRDQLVIKRFVAVQKKRQIFRLNLSFASYFFRDRFAPLRGGVGKSGHFRFSSDPGNSSVPRQTILLEIT